MEIHIQQCQNCGSSDLKNILYRVSGERDRVVVQCHQCQEFVASYIIAPMGYYHHGKGYDSFVRSCQRGGEFLSARKIRDIFKERTEKEVSFFERVTTKLKEKEINRG